MKVWQAAALGGILAMSLTQTENESPGATGRSATNARNAVTPLVEQVAGAVGDAVTVVRNEASRQGINPTAMLTPPADAGTDLGRDLQAIPSPTLPAGSGG